MSKETIFPTPPLFRHHNKAKDPFRDDPFRNNTFVILITKFANLQRSILEIAIQIDDETETMAFIVHRGTSISEY
ncbi:hypothetical protein CKAH01_18502 [Colletotrichum kahawae]|uniref:Uncharacterized protein n=1 Tax=Colletotrichum kahawae TaxID=34407 RepID=A0AAE0D400_COLKA|nr:hypothetical protein CKAH01_18502 [Colletotrichum kahawae]